MPAIEKCPECQSFIPADAPSGICPNCLLGLGSGKIPVADSGNDSIENALGADLAPAGPATDVGVATSGTATNGGAKNSGAPQANAVPASAVNHSSPQTDIDSGRSHGSGSLSQRPIETAAIVEHFPQLEILSKLGQGGMGAVYKVRQKTLDRIVALKVLPPALESDPAFGERFQREARALARLSHPHIVMIFEFGNAGPFHYILMEFVDGVNLREAIQTGGLLPNEALDVVPQVCEALQFAHDEGIVHRDIKPENILIDKRGRIKIADFGLAKIVSQSPDDFTLTATNQLVGTPRYMAPEQIEQPLKVDHRSDIYSLGVVFYEMLTGELPLGRFEAPSQRSETSTALDDIVMRTLEKEPDRRYQQASQVKTAVQQAAYQPGFDARQFPTATATKLPTIPVELTNVFLGLGSGKGLIKLDEVGRRLFLEVQIRGPLGGIFKSEFKEAHIGLDHVVSVRHITRWVNPSELILQTDALRELSQLPGIDNGRIRLVIDRTDNEQCRNFVSRLNSAIGLAEEPTDKPQPVNHSHNLAMHYPRPELTLPGIGYVFALSSILIVTGLFAGLCMEDDGFFGFLLVSLMGLLFFGPVLCTLIADCLGRTNRRRSRMLSAFALLPLHAGFLFSIPASIIMLRRLGRYDDQDADFATGAGPAYRPNPYEEPIEGFRSRFAGVAFLFTGILNVIALAAIAITIIIHIDRFSDRDFFAIFFPAVICGLGTSTLYIGWSLLQGVSLRMARFLAFLACLPLTFTCVLNIPIAIWVLIRTIGRKSARENINPYR